MKIIVLDKINAAKEEHVFQSLVAIALNKKNVANKHHAMSAV